jgi:hypothetical protein
MFPTGRIACTERPVIRGVHRRSSPRMQIINSRLGVHGFIDIDHDKNNTIQLLRAHFSSVMTVLDHSGVILETSNLTRTLLAMCLLPR